MIGFGLLLAAITFVIIAVGWDVYRVRKMEDEMHVLHSLWRDELKAKLDNDDLPLNVREECMDLLDHCNWYLEKTGA